MRSGLNWYDMEQGTPEWFAVRAGKITGTAAAALLVDGKGADGLGADAWTLIYRLAGEIVTGETDVEFDTFATLRGKNLEALAIQEYESETFRSANRVGFVQFGQYAGASPDFMVDEKRGGEVKCLMHPNHFRYCHTRQIEKAYMAQVQWSLFVTGFEVWDLVHYHPKAEAWRLVIDEIRPDMEMHGKFSERLSLVVSKIEEVVAMCREKALSLG